MDLDQELLDAVTEAEVTAQARRHYAETDSHQGLLKTRYDRAHRYYAPPDGDQWPEDKVLRPGMIHMTVNIIKPAVDTASRLESLLPRLVNSPDLMTEENRKRAEAAEKLMLRFLELSGWDVWLNDLTKCKTLYSKGVLKVFWNKRERRPDVTVIENPANLRIGWGTSDFRVIDWALYEYAISVAEAKRRYPEIDIQVASGDRGKLQVTRTGTHADPIGNVNTTSPEARLPSPNYIPSEYEQKQVQCWDYWFKDSKGVVKNAVFIQGVLAKKIEAHRYLPDIPYIIVEHDHEPGSPEGMNLVTDLIDIQDELNRAMSHWAQLVNDEIDPAWQINAPSVPAGMVPKGGQIVATGDTGQTITPISKGVNQLPLQQLVAELMKMFHFVSGLAEILFSLPPGAQTAGKALAVQIEASANRLDPRRRRLYRGLYELLLFWGFMIEKVNPKVDRGDGTKAGLADLVRGLDRWKFTAPEITPRDVAEATTNVLNKLQGKIVSLESAMDELGVNAPLEEIAKIMAERTNPALFPGDAQAYVAIMQLLQQMQAQAQALQAGPGGSPQDQAMGALQAQQQEAQPTLTEQDNQEAVPQPASLPGGPPTAGGPQLSPQTLIRSGADSSGQAQVLQQVAIR